MNNDIRASWSSARLQGPSHSSRRETRVRRSVFLGHRLSFSVANAVSDPSRPKARPIQFG
jgi:hypothetical protein